MKRKTKHLAMAISVALGTTALGIQAQVVVDGGLVIKDVETAQVMDMHLCADSTGATGATGEVGRCPPIVGGTGAGWTPCPAGMSFALMGDTDGSKIDNDDDRYFNILDDNQDDSGSSTSRTSFLNCGGTLSNFSVTLSQDPGESSESDAYVFTVMSPAGTTTSLGCTVTADSTSCSNTNSISLAPCNTINVRSEPMNNPSVEPDVDNVSSTFTLDGTVCSDLFPPIYDQ